MNKNDRHFLNFNYVKGSQQFLKEAGFVKYASEEMEEADANAVAEAMTQEGIDAPADAAMEDNKVLEIANTIVDLAQEQPSPVKEQLEEVATDIATSVAPAGEAVSESEVEAMPEEAMKEASQKVRDYSNKIASNREVAAKIAKVFAAKTKKAMDDDITNKKPEQVLTHSGTDYQKATSSANAPGTGQTDLKTEKGEVGAQENVENKVVEPVAPNSDLHQKAEGEDIYAKDYTAPGKGGTTLNTGKGEQGAQENVEEKIARLAMEQNLRRLMGRK